MLNLRKKNHFRQLQLLLHITALHLILAVAVVTASMQASTSFLQIHLLEPSPGPNVYHRVSSLDAMGGRPFTELPPLSIVQWKINVPPILSPWRKVLRYVSLGTQKVAPNGKCILVFTFLHYFTLLSLPLLLEIIPI